ncbi:MAG: gfo/Idh/MocA family oxidoreductase [Planctomycetota bacterium]|nr:MAG: gfo/Idh/MocA family oxidoreductase [Planctomycetota bacterium]
MAAKERFRVAVIGRTGRGGYGHQLDTAFLAVPQTEIVAVADDAPRGLKAAVERLGVKHGYTDYRRMLREVDCDIVAICPRWVDCHHEMAMAAAEHGRHMYIEKPFCRNLQEADEIVAACERAHLKLAVAHPTRYSPKLETVRRLIRQGAIGRVLEYRARGKEDRRGGGEDLWVLGTHMFDLIRALAGAPQWCFAVVREHGRPVTAEEVREGNEGLGPLAGDTIDAMFGTGSEAVAYFSSHRNAAGRPSRYALQIFGSEGIIEITEGTLPVVKILRDSSWSPGRSGKSWQDVSSAGIGQPEPLTGPQFRQRHTLAILDLLDAIRHDRQPKCNMYEARGTVEMVMAVFESHRVGGPVRMPLQQREHPLTKLR